MVLISCSTEKKAQQKLSSTLNQSSSSQILESSIEKEILIDSITDTLINELNMSSSLDVQMSSSVTTPIFSSSLIKHYSSEEQIKVFSSSSSSEVSLDTLVQDSLNKSFQTESPPDTSKCKEVPSSLLCDERDGHVYTTIRIGTQVWMGQNLNYASPHSSCYGNSLENCSKYGRLYQWVSAMDLEKKFETTKSVELNPLKHQGICPQGWFVPSKKDMEQLVQFVIKANKNSGYNEEVGTSLKKETGWEENDDEIEGTNRYGFAALACGFRDNNGSFMFLGEEADFWTTEESEDGEHAPFWSLYYANQFFLGTYKNLKSFSLSLRCIKKED